MKSFPYFLVSAGLYLLSTGACSGSEGESGEDPPGEGDGDGDGDGDSGGDGDGDSGGDGDGDQVATGSGGRSGQDEPTYFLEGIRLFEGGCLPRELPVDATGNLSCKLLDLAGPGYDCEASGVVVASAALVDATFTQLETDGFCGGATSLECASIYTVCELPQLHGAEAELCSTDPSDPSAFQSTGFCYIDDPESPLVTDCPVGEQRSLRAVGAGIPLQDGPDFLACGE